MSTTQSLDQLFDGTAQPQGHEPARDPAPQERSEPAAETATTGEQTDAAPPAAASTQRTEQEAALVPRKALEDERRKRQELERWREEVERQMKQARERSQHSQPPPQKPDWFTDPEGAAKILEAQMEQRLLNDRANFSERFAVKQHGKDLVDQATQWALQTGAAQHFFLNSPDPYEDVIKAYRKATFMSEIGDDPEAYKAKLRAELMAELGQQPAAQPSPQSIQSQSKPPVPKSLAGARSEQPRAQNGQWASAPSLSQLLD